MRRHALNPLNNNTQMPPSALRNPRSTYSTTKPTPDHRRTSMMPLPPTGRRSTMTTTNNNTMTPRSSVPIRNSTATTSRSGLRHDPRPLTDRGFLQQSIRKLISFIVERGYNESQISPKTLLAPSSREFESIFLFLLQRLDPTFSFLAKRFEDEIPLLLKCFGYPFSMSRSSLSAIGSPHTWPSLIGVLLWFMGLVIFDEQSQAVQDKQKAEAVQRDHHVRRKDYFFQNTIKAYSLWLDGMEQFDQVDKERDEFFQNENRGTADEITQLEQAVSSLKISEESFRTNAAPLAISKQHLATLEQNVNKMANLLKSLSDHGNSVQELIKDRLKDIQEDKQESQTLRAKKQHLEQVLARQEDEAIDAERIVSDREKAKQGLSKVSQDREQVEQEQKELERRVAKSMEKLSSTLTEYHRDLESYDRKKDNNNNSSEEIHQDIDILDVESVSVSISRDAAETDARKIVSKDLNDIMKTIEHVRENVMASQPNLNEEMLKLHEELDEAEERGLKLKHEVNVLRGHTEQREAEYSRKKMEWKKFMEERGEKILKNEEERVEVTQQGEKEVAEAKKRVEEIQELKRQLLKRREANRQKMLKHLSSDIQVVQQHRQEMESSAQQIKQSFNNQVKSFNSLSSSN